jgi:uncharacterized membrane protein YidH (DUF202 family)
MSRKRQARRFLKVLKKVVRNPKPTDDEKRMMLLEEQTLLSKERTVLSFMRTGLALLGAGVVLVSIFPGDPLIVVTGWAFIIGGIAEIIESSRRLRRVQDEVEKINEKLGR